MKNIDLLKRIVFGIQSDLVDYRSLRELQEKQFEAALRHDTAALVDVASDMGMLCAELERRRRHRVALLEQEPELARLPCEQQVPSLLEQLPSAPRTLAMAAWQDLGGLIRECKALNTRNCQLIVDQYEIMQRVLGQEEATYAPR
ncbi:MAG: hypothetical protein CGU28_06575 [Candidatus Dactylopiibacterium carminicum]|uniref:Flagellar protein FlgN n=1 Tax=Candidatus Dactylopiibacterium carminicum TaxID=857335 RepID=A0A272EXV7_9RHOO|nr:hypothetical protein [Candidatus Dactylopiibacterium carminicum]KAF7599959.1 hypothetical protein BGI27_05055 [Candidatus Dactylopiibacterium carminicum]PAS94460.1 MAG: hypothetical protein CGU29_03885 [Candidatus Dactylopiibacterium carminicum]PAS97055.1 MAG: hypothetical protein CGU28_06575 [Candidatus Dactylopiibacterium carminicum]PAS99962.1 MAG: hypothetical protein BSR46_05090 [Candidatus Dactylopiibacterium carminicum]